MIKDEANFIKDPFTAKMKYAHEITVSFKIASALSLLQAYPSPVFPRGLGHVIFQFLDI